jgi:aspartate racemase
MKRLGILGGIGPESTIDYYRATVSRFRERSGGKSPSILIHSIDVDWLLALAGSGDLAALTEFLLDGMEPLERAGAEVGLMAANTPHLVFDAVQAGSRIPMVSVVDCARRAAVALGSKRLLLLGSEPTMAGDFYPRVFAASGIEVLPPERKEDRLFTHERYVGELVRGRFTPETRDGYLAVIERMRAEHGVDGVILGGTELPLLLRDMSAPVPLLDTAKLHVEAAVEAMLG